jgi:hypothetical protein
MGWLTEDIIKDLLEKDMKLIYEHCGFEVLKSLIENMPGLQLYISEKAVDKARRRFIRKLQQSGTVNVKAVALILGRSERFVWKALAGTEENDDRQGGLF